MKKHLHNVIKTQDNIDKIQTKQPTVALYLDIKELVTRVKNGAAKRVSL